MASPSSSSAPLAIGDVLRFYRGNYSHLAIFIGENAVIHRWAPTPNDAFRVRIDPVETVVNAMNHATAASVECCTAQLDAEMLRVHQLVPKEAMEVVQRAQSKLGDVGYAAWTSNCEHFVTWARYGVSVSPQATAHTGDVLAGALLGAAVAGMAGFLVGGAITLLTKATLFTTSMGASMGASIGNFGDDVKDDVDEEETEAVEEEKKRDVKEKEKERIEVLATKLAEDQLRCGICFEDLRSSRAVAFPCQHFTCSKCFDAFVADAQGYKTCPYCRMTISRIATIAKSTKHAAQLQMLSHDSDDDGEYVGVRSDQHPHHL